MCRFDFIGDEDYPDDDRRVMRDGLKANGELQVEDTVRLMGAIRNRQVKNHWLQKRASEKLGLNYKGLLRLDKDYSRRTGGYIADKACMKNLSPGQIWSMAYRIRKSNVLFANKVVERLKYLSGLSDEVQIDLVTVCKKEMFDNLDDERRWSIGKENDVAILDSFDGDIQPILDMESCDQDPVDIMLDWLERSGACRVFSEVDGHMASYHWTDSGWLEKPYPMLKSLYEKRNDIEPDYTRDVKTLPGYEDAMKSEQTTFTVYNESRSKTPGYGMFS